MNSHISIIIGALATVTPALGASVAESTQSPAENGGAADSAEFVTPLRGVEVVGLKQGLSRTIDLSSQINALQLQRNRVLSVRDISDMVPNLYIPRYGSRMTSSIYMRGLGSRIDQPAVGLNVDNVPYLNKDSYDFTMADIERVEVIRGSAGVLNGRNALAGQINVHTLSPWAYRGFRMAAHFGRGNDASASAGWYGHLTDNLATSITAGIGSTEGFFRNEYFSADSDDERERDHAGEEHRAQARWKLSWHPDSRWSIANTAALSWSNQEGMPYESVETGRICYNDSTFYRRLHFTDGLSVSYTGRHMIATSVTSVQYMNDNMTMDQDFMPEDYFTLTQKRHEWSFTEDLFAKGVRGRYSWLTGVFGFAKKTRMWAPVTFRDYGLSTLIEKNINSNLPKGMELKWDDRRLILGSDFHITDGGFALYHQSTVDLGPLTAEIGLRWDIEHVSMDYVNRCNTSVTMYRTMPDGSLRPLAQRPVAIDSAGNLSQTFNEVLPQLSLRWDINASAYLRASVSKGYKAGGYNPQMFSNVLQARLMHDLGAPGAAIPDIESLTRYKPEKAWTYELSGAYSSSDGRFSAELTGFLIRCRDQQLTVFPEGSATGRAMTNADRTRSLGAELTMRWQPTDAIWLNAAYGYTKATFRSYTSGGVDYRGKNLPYAPRNTVFASAYWRLPWTFAKISATIGANTNCAGAIYWDDANTLRQNFYATLGAEIILRHDIAELSVWGKNLTDTRYSTFYFKSIGHQFVQRADPWAIGLSVRINLNRFADH